MMMKDMFKPEFVFTNVVLTENTKEMALNKISELCSEKNAFNKDELLKAFLVREEMDSTGFGSGVAIPHAKIKQLESPMVAVVRFAEAIEWGAIDDEPVKVAIALIMPKTDEANTHLQVISKFARLLVHDEFVENLTGAKDSKNLYNYIINEVEGV